MRDEPNSAALDDGLADLELGSRRPNTPPDADVHTRLIALGPLRLALPREHPLAAQRRVRLADVADEPFINLRSASALRRLTDNLLEQAASGPMSSSRATTCPTCVASSRLAWAWPSSPRPAPDHPRRCRAR